MTALRRDLPALTSLRSAAALMVFGYHVGHGVVPHNPFVLGYTGVAFFFVLSGFVLTWGTNPATSASKFFVRRIARIYPSHLVVWLLVLALPIVSGPQGPRHALLNLTLLQAWSVSLSDVFSVNGVTWSLSCELFFYALFPALFALTARHRLRVQWAAALALFAAAAVVVVIGSYTSPSGHFALFAGANPVVRLPEFVLGVVGARTLQAGVRLPRWAYAAAFLWACGLLVDHGSPAGATWLAPVFLVVIMTASQLTVDGVEVLSQPRLVYAGKVSFCFYLVHQLVLNETFHLVHPTAASTLCALVLSCLLAAALHHLVELPGHRLVTGWFSARKQTTPSDAVAE